MSLKVPMTRLQPGLNKYAPTGEIQAAIDTVKELEEVLEAIVNQKKSKT